MQEEREKKERKKKNEKWQKIYFVLSVKNFVLVICKHITLFLWKLLFGSGGEGEGLQNGGSSRVI